MWVGGLCLGWWCLCCWARWRWRLLGLRYYLMHDSRFVVATSDDVQITGAEHLTRDQVLTVFGADLERNIFRVPLAERQADLERLPWVAHATVMRLLPDRSAGADYGADAGGVCAAGNADWAGGCERRAAGYAAGCGGRSALFVSGADGFVGAADAVGPGDADGDLRAVYEGPGWHGAAS